MDEAQSVQGKVREIIEGARREQAKELNLSSHRLLDTLEVIPDEVFSLSHLESLSLDDNKIREVPERIRDLTNLRRLSLIGNPLKKVPDIPGLRLDWASYLRCRKTLSRENIEGILIEVDITSSRTKKWVAEARFRNELTQLPHLLELSISLYDSRSFGDITKPTKNIRELIDNINEFHLLESLSIEDMLLGEVPAGIKNLKELRSLTLNRVGISEIPDWIGELRHLQRLSLSENELSNLPDSLSRMSELESISLWDNRFSEMPKTAFRLKNLTEIDLDNIGESDGLIRQIPAEILELPKLKKLLTGGQPIETPPPEVVREGVEAIKNYWRQQQEVGVDYLAEAKLIILGEAGAGKTSLARKIEDRGYELKPQEASTEGIDVIRWGFPSAVRVKREGREELHQTDFKVNIWDFGGQEIYHATHQFFLTRRSLYALVADDRKEDTDFNYWLQVVELLSDRSPLLIVQNEKQDRQRDVDLATLRARFPNLREAFRVNLATGRGLDELERAVRQELEHLPHIGTPLPKTWSQVRAAMETDDRNYIGLEEYLRICQENGFKRREDKLQLSGYLHDLGICLHFQDDPVLKNTVILKPKWGTDAVYSVLDDRVVVERRGQFGPEDLERIWAGETYSDMRDELLRLMMRFQLCYQLPDREVYIAPQLLSPERPAYEWEGRGEFVLRYDYEFMPKGILTRFIVAVNHLIEGQGLVWKSGVVLARDGSRAEVVEDYTRRKINVRVSGPDARGLLAIADDQLDRIHASFPRLKYEKYLPCNCEVCRKREEPYAYPLSELKDFAVQGDAIQCRVSRKLVDAADLIRDVLPFADYTFDKAFAAGVKMYRELTRVEEPPPPAKEVFVSYSWSEESTAVVDKIEEALGGGDVTLVRDKSEMRYRDSIGDFMRRIGRGKCIVVVLSKKYLESKSCMFELTEIAKLGDMRDRVFPVVLDDADIYDGVGRLRYIKHWERKKKELDEEMDGVGGEYLQGIREEIDLYTDIRNTIARIVDILGDMNALTPEQHRGSNFDALISAVEARLSE